MIRRRWLVVAITGTALVLLLGRVLAGVYVDYRWFEALDATTVWWARIENLALLRVGFGLLGTLFIFANLYAVRHSVVSLVLPRRVANLEIGEEVRPGYLLAAVIVLSLVIGALLALLQDDWTSLVLVRSGVPFRESDPYYEADLGFFTYWLPFEASAHFWSLIALLTATTAVVFLYALTPSLRWERGTLHVSQYVRRHLTTLGALLLFLLAWSYRLDAYGLLTDGTGPAGAFTSLDYRPGIPVNLLLAFVTCVLAVLVLWAGWYGQIRVAFASVTIVLVLSLGLRQLLPLVTQRLNAPVDPDKREGPYTRTRALYTRRAYDIDADRIVRGDSTIAYDGMRDAVNSVAAWDPAAIVRGLERRRQGRVDGGVGWAADSGRLIALAVQQPAGPEGIDPATPWTLSRLRASMSDARGGMVGLDPTRTDEGTSIDAALISDSASGYLVIADPEGGVAAPEIRTWPSLLAHAWDQQNLRLLFSDTEVREPRMVLRRAARTRVAALVPFFEPATQIAPLVFRDSLYWVVHLYSASDSYPLSEKLHFGASIFSYVHHAATALVQAHSGRVTIVADSVLDPIARTWTTRFPSLFSTWSALPAEIADLVPPPIDGAQAQASALAHVGTGGELVPAAHLPSTAGADTAFAGARWPLFVAPGGRVTAYSIPVLDAADRVRGMVITVGGAQWTTYWHPVPEPAPRWAEVITKLQHVDASPPTRDVPLKRGPVRAIPVRDGAAFVQTTYAWRGDGPPSITRVGVAVNGGTPSSGATLAEAAGARDVGPIPPKLPLSPPEFRQRVDELYAAMRDAMRRGDWTAFGNAYEELGRVLRATPR
jgi:uncharacterized membrane protein (UPF0182 family)